MFLRGGVCLRILQISIAMNGKGLFSKKNNAQRYCRSVKYFADTDVIAENVFVLIFVIEMYYIVYSSIYLMFKAFLIGNITVVAVV